jgi:hypothetical protein
MAERAQVSSVEAIASFRSQLLVYITRARATLEELSDEILHTRAWIEHDRRSHWEREFRLRARQLDEAEQELFSARLSRIQTQTTAQVLRVERAKRTLAEAEEKRARVKRWTREFDNRSQPLAKQAEQLLTFITTDLVKAAAYLGSVVKILDAYLATSPGGTVPLPPLGEAESIESTEDSPPVGTRDPAHPGTP